MPLYSAPSSWNCICTYLSRKKAHWLCTCHFELYLPALSTSVRSRSLPLAVSDGLTWLLSGSRLISVYSCSISWKNSWFSNRRKNLSVQFWLYLSVHLILVNRVEIFIIGGQHDITWHDFSDFLVSAILLTHKKLIADRQLCNIFFYSMLIRTSTSS